MMRVQMIASELRGGSVQAAWLWLCSSRFASRFRRRGFRPPALAALIWPGVVGVCYVVCTPENVQYQARQTMRWEGAQGHCRAAVYFVMLPLLRSAGASSATASASNLAESRRVNFFGAWAGISDSSANCAHWRRSRRERGRAGGRGAVGLLPFRHNRIENRMGTTLRQSGKGVNTPFPQFPWADPLADRHFEE